LKATCIGLRLTPKCVQTTKVMLFAKRANGRGVSDHSHSCIFATDVH